MFKLTSYKYRQVNLVGMKRTVKALDRLPFHWSLSKIRKVRLPNSSKNYYLGASHCESGSPYMTKHTTTLPDLTAKASASPICLLFLISPQLIGEIKVVTSLMNP